MGTRGSRPAIKGGPNVDGSPTRKNDVLNNSLDAIRYFLSFITLQRKGGIFKI